MLVSVNQAKVALRYDGTDNDVEIEMAVKAASAAVLSYLKWPPDSFVDSFGDIPLDSAGDPIGIPADIQQAVIYWAGRFLADPAGITGNSERQGGVAEWEHFQPPRAVVALLTPYRKPTLA
jgi:hypothetical protein